MTHAGLVRVLARHGRELEGVDEHPDELLAGQPVLASCYGASAGDRQLFSDAAGHRTDKLTRPVVAAPPPSGPVAEVGGVNVHAKVAIEPSDIDAILRGMPPRSRAPPRAHPDQLELDLSVA